MRPKTVTLSISNDRDGICAAQQRTGSGALTINGALASSSVVSRTTAEQVSVYSAGNLSGVTFTVSGKGYDTSGRYSASLSETITGPNATTVYTTKYFLYVSSVSTSGTIASDAEVGTSGIAVSQLIPVNRHTYFPIGLQTVVSGTMSYDVEYTMIDVYDTSLTLSYEAATNMSSASASASSAIDGSVSAVRVRTNSGSDGASVSLTVDSN